MKIKKFLVVLASIFSVSLFAGNIFASYTISDEAAKSGIKISLDVPDKQYYLNAGVWETQNPVYFAHFWNGAPALDVKMDACASAGYYTCEASMLYRNVCFVRMPTGSTSLDWDTKWNQTKDITIDLDYDTYEITDWGVDDLAITAHGDNHDPKVRYETITPATASECAVKNKITYCGICEEILEQESFIDHEHITEHAAIAATCTQNGNIHYYSCDHCGKYYSDALAEHEIANHSSVIIPSTGHSFTDNYGSDATNHWLICDHGCGATDSIEPHTFVNGVCSVCGYVQAHVHSYVNHPAVAATCTSTGNEQYYTCSGCNHIFNSNYEEINAIPTTPMIAHSYVNHPAVAPNCTTAGNEQYYTCSACGHIFNSNHEEISAIPSIAALGHHYENHVCTTCGAIETGYTMVHFTCNIDTSGGKLYIVLIHDPNPQEWLEMTWTDGNNWYLDHIFATGTSIKFKVVKSYGYNNDVWENGSDRTWTIPDHEETYVCYWQY